jgi:hypothetical protein
MFSTYPKWYAARIHPFPLIFFIACNIYFATANFASFSFFPIGISLTLGQVNKIGVGVLDLVTHNGSLSNMHWREIDNAKVAFSAYI